MTYKGGVKAIPETDEEWLLAASEHDVTYGESPTVYANDQPVDYPPIEAQEAIAREIADGAAMGSVEVGGVTYSWD